MTKRNEPSGLNHGGDIVASGPRDEVRLDAADDSTAIEQPEPSAQRLARVLAIVLVVAASIGLLVVIAVRRDGDASPATSESTESPEPSPQAATSTPTTRASSGAKITGPPAYESVPAPGENVRAVPTTVSPGMDVSIYVQDGRTRSVGWLLSVRSEDQWMEPTYFLIAAVDGYRCFECKPWLGPDEPWGNDDFPATGPGPDVVTIPDVASDGRYRICMASSAEPQCAEIVVSRP